MAKNKAILPEPTYGDFGYGDVEPFATRMCYCPVCHMEVPFMNYCGECGQKFLKPKDDDNKEED
jgi:predicted amidophosphoribosyltransferase